MKLSDTAVNTICLYIYKQVFNQGPSIKLNQKLFFKEKSP